MSLRDKQGAKVDLDRPRHDLWTYLMSINKGSKPNIRAVAALMLKLLGDLTHDEIGSLLKTPRGRVTRLIRKGKSLAKSQLKVGPGVDVSTP